MRFSRVIVLLVLSMMVGACYERPPGATPSFESSACLDGAWNTVADYFHGQASAGQVSGVFDCASRALKDFATYADGAQKGVYSAEELRGFLQKFYIRNLPITDGLLAEAMELKRTLVGGGPDTLTVHELDQARSLLTVLKSEALRLAPFMPLNPDHLDQVSSDFLEEALGALNETADNVGAALQATDYPYYFTHLDLLLAELEAIGARHHFAQVNALSRLRDSLPLDGALKSALIGPEADRIAGDEWARFLAAAARWYGIYLRLHRLRSTQSDWLRSPALDEFTGIVYESLDLLEHSLARHSNQMVSVPEIDHIIDNLPSDLLHVRIGTAKAFLTPLLCSYLQAFDYCPANREEQGLTVAALHRMKSAFGRWVEGQKSIELLFGNRETQTDPVNTIQEIIRAEPLFFGQPDSIATFPVVGSGAQSFHNLSMMNWIHELTRLYMTGYARASDPENPRMTFEDVRRSYEEARPLGIELKLFDPTNHLVPAKRFREANLFTYAGNGDNLLDFEEASQLLALLVSGKVLAAQIHADLASRCHGGPEDLYGYPQINARCYRKNLIERFAQYFSRMPGLTRYFDALDGARKVDFEKNFEITARKDGYSNTKMDSEDSEGFAISAQYLEVLMRRFDLDHSGDLDMDEADRAFPVFRNTLAQISGKTDEGDLRLGFTYMLKYGAAPSLLSGAYWMVARPFSDLHADRGMIMRIFAYLSAKAASPAN